jgi:hypothetical protein
VKPAPPAAAPPPGAPPPLGAQLRGALHTLLPAAAAAFALPPQLRAFAVALPAIAAAAGPLVGRAPPRLAAPLHAALLLLPAAVTRRWQAVFAEDELGWRLEDEAPRAAVALVAGSGYGLSLLLLGAALGGPRVARGALAAAAFGHAAGAALLHRASAELALGGTPTWAITVAPLLPAAAGAAGALAGPRRRSAALGVLLRSLLMAPPLPASLWGSAPPLPEGPRPAGAPGLRPWSPALDPGGPNPALPPISADPGAWPCGAHGPWHRRLRRGASAALPPDAPVEALEPLAAELRARELWRLDLVGDADVPPGPADALLGAPAAALALDRPPAGARWATLNAGGALRWDGPAPSSGAGVDCGLLPAPGARVGELWATARALLARPAPTCRALALPPRAAWAGPPPPGCPSPEAPAPPT